MRPQVDTTIPRTTQLDHVRNNLKGEQLLEDRYREIDKENRILLQKMSDVMRQQTPGQTPRAKSGPPSMNRDARKTELMRITQDNFAILKRIQQAQPVYNHIAWEDAYRKNFGYLKNASEFPVVLNRKTSASHVGSDTPTQSGNVALDAPRPETGKSDRGVGELAVGDELRYVLKQGKSMGDQYYLVEMATDGVTLAISAYDGEQQQNLELVVNERNHRKLYRECKGDYSLIAERLVVDNGALFIDTGSSPRSNIDTGATRAVAA